MMYYKPRTANPQQGDVASESSLLSMPTLVTCERSLSLNKMTMPPFVLRSKHKHAYDMTHDSHVT